MECYDDAGATELNLYVLLTKPLLPRGGRRRVERYDDTGATELNLFYVLLTKPLGAGSW